MTEIQTYDIAVIGYGPSGVTAANLLGAQDLRVVVIEREQSVYSRARTLPPPPVGLKITALETLS